MPRLLVLPGLLSPDDEPDLLPNFARLPRLKEARLRRLSFADGISPAPLWLGLEPSEGELAPGPLRVAALGADPPERSTHFGLDYLRGTPEALALSGGVPDVADFRALLAPLLRGPFRLLPGEAASDALVWEGLGAFRTLSPEEAAGQSLKEATPDGEPWLRRFVDDAANLFLDAEPNRVRRGEGRSELLTAWPWGAGTRLPVPSLPLRLGRPLSVSGGPESFRGLARLAGARARGEAEIVVLDDASRWRTSGGFEEVEARLLRELLPQVDALIDDPLLPVAIAFPDDWSASRGLWAGLIPGRDGEDELRREMLQERRVPTLGVPRAIAGFLASE